MSFAPEKDAKLGSLTQEARGKHLKSARGILFFVGIATILLNAFGFVMLNSEVAKAGVLNAEQKQLVATAMLTHGSAIALGFVFIGLGLLIKQYPVPITALSLILYIGSNAVYGMLEPETLVQGIIVKVIIVVALVKSLQAAIAYQKEEEEIKRMELNT